MVIPWHLLKKECKSEQWKCYVNVQLDYYMYRMTMYRKSEK
jgi:hypothetical protein